MNRIIDWYKVSMSVADVASGKGIQLQEAFEKVFAAFQAPLDAGMFGGGIHSMSNEYFFSPRAAQIAMPLIIACQGAKCDAPKRTEVAMLVVNRGAENVALR